MGEVKEGLSGSRDSLCIMDSSGVSHLSFLSYVLEPAEVFCMSHVDGSNLSMHLLLGLVK